MRPQTQPVIRRSIRASHAARPSAYDFAITLVAFVVSMFAGAGIVSLLRVKAGPASRLLLGPAVLAPTVFAHYRHAA